jgi:hypothetical protein
LDGCCRWMIFKDTGIRPQNDLEHCIMPNEITYCDWRVDDMPWDYDPSTGEATAAPNRLLQRHCLHPLPGPCLLRVSSGLLKHRRSGQCLAAPSSEEGPPALVPCQSADDKQRWEAPLFDVSGRVALAWRWQTGKCIMRGPGRQLL